MSKAQRFARNVGWNALGQIGIFAINLLTIPYLVRSMGIETYGLYILMHAATSYLLLLALGGGATVKFTAEFAGAGDGGGWAVGVRRGLPRLGRAGRAVLRWPRRSWREGCSTSPEMQPAAVRPSLRRCGRGLAALPIGFTAGPAALRLAEHAGARSMPPSRWRR